MKKSLCIICLIFVSNIFSQSITGTVVDENKQPLSGANIYIDGTTIATITDENGKFVLYSGGTTNSLVAISYVGYQTQYISKVDDKPLFIALIEANNTLKEVIIYKDRFTRKEKMKLFREEFLGKTSNANSCKIENEEAIRFKYDKKSKSIKAFADEPLQIINRSFGYQINYELVDFEVQFNDETINSTAVVRSFYSGLSYFKTMETSDNTLKKRAKSYEGSQLQFFRNLTNGLWNKDNFLLFKSSHPVDPKTIFEVSDAGDYKKIQIAADENIQSKGAKFMAQFQLLYDKKQQSGITFETDIFYVDKFGNNSNIQDIMFSGFLSVQKVGDMLPLNYGIE